MTTAAIPDVGWVDGLDASVYHAHPALSSSGMRRLLPPSTPAHFKYGLEHQRPPTREMELGTCVHTEVLGVGTDWTVVDAKDWRSKAAQDFAQGARDRGLIPVLPSERDLILGMADAVAAHPLAGPLLFEGTGTPERALFWRDEKTGVHCRALVDFSPHNRASLVDVKTCRSAAPADLPRHMAQYGYDVQAAHYMRGGRALGLLEPDAEFIWVFVEREAPHMVSVVRLAPVDMQYAHDRCTLAYELYRDCTAADSWPGYGDGLRTITLPGWTRRDHDITEEQQW